jgi:hypothetical protein
MRTMNPLPQQTCGRLNRTPGWPSSRSPAPPVVSQNTQQIQPLVVRFPEGFPRSLPVSPYSGSESLQSPPRDGCMQSGGISGSGSHRWTTSWSAELSTLPVHLFDQADRALIDIMMRFPHVALPSDLLKMHCHYTAGVSPLPLTPSVTLRVDESTTVPYIAPLNVCMHAYIHTIEP